MVLPHRTAWTTRTEFEQVFSDLFASEGDRARQLGGLSRIAVCQSRAQCPSAVETTAHLLRLILLDSDLASTRPSAHELRLSYSMTLIRFVNSLVDPLQTAYYARSISSLAAQLGLPLWFVELRHHATHEQLPALPVLRQGAREALDWLYGHYWLPALASTPGTASTSTSSTLPPLPLEPFLASLESYKQLTKSLQKDASQAGKVKNELGRVWRDLERWGIDNGISPSTSSRKSLNPNGLARVTATRTRERAIETVAAILVDEPGWLIPLAKKKRPSTRSRQLSSTLVELYTPLLEFLDETLFAPSTPSAEPDEEDQDTFIDVLIARMVEILCSSSTTTDPNNFDHSPAQQDQPDPTVHLTLQAWILHLLPFPDRQQQLEDGSGGGEVVQGIVKTCLIAATPSSIALVDSILQRTINSMPTLINRVEPLLQVVRTNLETSSSTFVESVKVEETDRVLETILHRAEQIEKQLASNSMTGTINNAGDPVSIPTTTTATTGGSGWEFVQNFRPSPIGALPTGGFETLDLSREVEMVVA
ncbi:rRNA-processing protein LAS1 [Sporobolomyces koalae]|uniref:rRNA-processing protein LAS1 n=1 Tax=Sporobolomyces koalae TaxID=500713 RepID=UPI00316FBEE5